MKKLEQIVSDGIDAFHAQDFELALKLIHRALTQAAAKGVNSKTKELLHSNKGYTLLAMKEFKLARKHFRIANIFAFNDENCWSQFLCLANLGKWSEAVKFHHYRYGKTRTAPTKVTFPDLPLPMASRLEDLHHKRVLILNEQGLGDEILFFSGIRKLASQMREVHLQCYPETLRLFQANCPDNVYLFTDRTISETFIRNFDIYTCSGDIFAYSTQNSLNYTHFLTMPEKDRKGTGFCWKANALSPNSVLRSITPDRLEPYKTGSFNQSLQMNETDRPDWMAPFSEDIKDLYDTAELISGLWAVTTIDSCIAHLSGSMDIPTTLLINQHFDWRWRSVDDKNYSLIYPSVKVVQL